MQALWRLDIISVKLILYGKKYYLLTYLLHGAESFLRI